MNVQYGHSFIVRAIAGVSLAASIIGSAGSAFAHSCIIPYPHQATPCAQGSLLARSSNLQVGASRQVTVDFEGGTTVAIAYPIDVNGNHLNTCDKTAADQDNRDELSASVSCMTLYGTPGTATFFRNYTHPINIQSTFVLVI